MSKGKKHHLYNIQEFGTTAYIKDLPAGKLDARVQKGRLVGYDSKSKGYQIYWPTKQSVSIEHNVTFNPEDLQLQGDKNMRSMVICSMRERERKGYPEK
jgi:hypothetical protein